MLQAWGILIIFVSIFIAGEALKASGEASHFCEAKLSTIHTSPPAASAVDYSKPTVIIGDGYSSGRFLAKAFEAEGVQIVHIHSHGKPPKANYERTFNRSDYALDIPFNGNMDLVIQNLRQFKNIKAVVTGADSGVMFTQNLAFKLSSFFSEIPADPVRPEWKDKFLQNEALHANDIDSALQIQTSRTSDALKWIHKNKLFETGPKMVVIKPLKSASTDGVHFCQNDKDVKQAMKELIGEPDEFGNINNKVLIQEYLEGDEYVVNATSLDGHHVITEILVYHKRLSRDGKRLVYDYDMLLPFRGEAQDKLVPYLFKMLSALGIKNGNTHTEIKLVPGRGPVNVELNYRMMGSGLPMLMKAALGTSQVDRTVMAILHPEKFKTLPLGYEITKRAAVVTLSNPSKGSMLRTDIDAVIRSIPGYFSHSLNFKIGESLPETIDLNTPMADVFLISNTSEELMLSIEKLRNMADHGELTILSD